MRSLVRLSLLVLAAALTAAAFPPTSRAVGAGAKDRTIAYWTPERMASARLREFVFAPGASHGTLIITSKSTTAAKGLKATPTPPPSGGTLSSTTGSSWPGGGLALTATGKVFFSMGGGNYVCSGAAVTDTRSGYDLVLTAGHCAYDQVARAFAEYWLFVPAYDLTPNLISCVDSTYGCFTATALVVHSGFANAGGFNSVATTFDWAFAVVGPSTKSGQQLSAAVGSFPLSTSSLTSGWSVAAFGYPAAKPYTGDDLVYCAGVSGQDANNSNKTWSLPCNMTGGSSGGPWMSTFTTDRGVLSSVNSYRYSNQSNMYGPKFNASTQSTFTAANSATGNTVVP